MFDPKWLIKGSIHANDKGLISLKGAPSHVAGNFDCDRNKLTSLVGGPSRVDGIFFCNFNRLTSLEGAPLYVGRDFYCSSSKLKSLKDIHLQIKHIGGNAYFDGNPIESHVLGMLLIEGLLGVLLNDRFVASILNRHLPSKGMESVLEAQEELILAGYEEYAQL